MRLQSTTPKSKTFFKATRASRRCSGPILNQVLDAEMSEHLRAAPHEQTERRQGYRNGSYERQLTTRVGTLNLEVPRDREGTFQTALFDRYQRSEKALVLALMQMVSVDLMRST